MAGDRERIDKWLWFARFARTRTTAQKIAQSGKVRINRQKIAAAAASVRVGDVLTLALEGGVRVVRIAALASRRGPAAEARLLYDDLTPPAEKEPSPFRSGPRPTKRDRRAIDALRNRGPSAVGEDE